MFAVVSARTPLSGPPKAAHGCGFGLDGMGTKKPRIHVQDGLGFWNPTCMGNQVDAPWDSRENP